MQEMVVKPTLCGS